MTTDNSRATLLPEPTELNQAFWDGLAEGKLRLQHCGACGFYQYPPETFCYRCGSSDVAWEDVSGKGTVHTFITVHQPYHPAFREIMPYNVSVIELAEGPRIVSNVVSVDPHDVRIGMSVHAVPREESNGQFALCFEAG